MKKLFLFDFDGVIADSLHFYADLSQRALEKMGTPVIRNTDDFLELFEGNFYEGLIRKGIDLGEYFNASAEIFATADYSKVSPMPGLLPVVKELASRHVLAVISSNSSEAVHEMIRRFGFNGCFREIMGADFKLSKKDKIDHAVAAYGVDRDSTYYIGDTTGDIKEAREAGVRSIAVSWGWHSREKMAKALPDYLIDDPTELLNL
ncbi:MAG: HAD family hydrolase [Smithellaceae bacterium]|nr:HAD family hydrolase [Smithellaceae bacterium]